MYSHTLGKKIDTAMLSRILKDLDSHLSKPIAICAMGGTALMLLRLKKGSMDIDILPQKNSFAVKEALSYVQENILSGKIHIPITENKREVKRYLVNPDLIIQTFVDKIPLQAHNSFLILPKNYPAYMHEVKTVDWVIPEGGITKRLSTKRIFKNITLYTLGVYDLICTKIFMPRQKDIEDIYALYTNIPLTQRFLSSKKKQMLERFLMYVYTNEKDIKLVVSGIKFYQYLLNEKHLDLEPVPTNILSKYKDYLK